MRPPQGLSGTKSATRDARSAVFLGVSTLNKRRDFQRASGAHRIAKPGFILQMRQRGQYEPDGIRVGFTCSKKVGNAVARNRAKRRLREIARLGLVRAGQKGTDYVLIGRKSTTADLPFETLLRDFDAALATLHRSAK